MTLTLSITEWVPKCVYIQPKHKQPIFSRNEKSLQSQQDRKNDFIISLFKQLSAKGVAKKEQSEALTNEVRNRELWDFSARAFWN